ncbi:Guanine nucleotide-binding protein subunit gamma-1, partial [Biomphalaria glabrata]
MPAYTNAREAEALRRAKMELQSLQTQSRMKRQKTSETIKDLENYCNNNLKNDRLIYPDKITSSPKMNKFQEGLQQQRRLIEQLRCEAQITRFRVSQCIDDLQKYCDSHIEEDYLISGFSKPSENPFKEKGSCAIL